MKKELLTFVGGAVVGALGMKFAPKLMSSLKRDDNDVDELMDEFDELVDEFDDLVVPEPTEEPKAEPKAEPTEPTPSPENGEEEKGGENNEE